MRKTKIIATIGPRWANDETIYSIIKEGADVLRLNFSFGTHEEHLNRINIIRNASKKLGKPVAILADLQGPKIRVGILKEDRKVENGEIVFLSGNTKVDDDSIIPTTHGNIAGDVREGYMILIADGTIQLVVENTDVEKKLVKCRVMTGGTILTGKGINLPGAHVTTEILTEKDVSDALFAASKGVNYLGMSFVRHEDDIIRLRDILNKNGYTKVGIVSKIENTQSLENLENIIKQSDAVMVARGDLGVEIPFAEVPIKQKHILKLANNLGKVTIIATQMLESMTKSPVPSRAEASDVANAVLDGTDVVMMSAETASGDYPVQSIQAMVKIVLAAENAMSSESYKEVESTTNVGHALAESASYMSYCIDNKCIVGLSRTGRMIKLLSKKRPKTPIIFFSSHEDDCSSLALYNNVHTVLMHKDLNFSEEISHRGEIDLLEDELVKRGFANHKDTAIIVSGSKWQGRWQENSIRIIVVH